MSYNILAVQEAIQAQLSASAPLATLLGSPLRLYDHPTPASAYPFVLYGDQQAFALDTKDTTGIELSLTLLTYSRARGRRELRQIESALYTALHQQALTVTGANFCQCQFVRSQQNLESDGLTYRGQLEFRITVTD